MSLLWIICAIYGLGALFVLCLGIHLFAHLAVDRPFTEVVRTTPRLILNTTFGAVIWPYALLACPEFREIVIETGRIAIIFGYLFCVLMTFAYPLVWVWYISFCLSWFLLETYHNKKKRA